VRWLLAFSALGAAGVVAVLLAGGVGRSTPAPAGEAAGEARAALDDVATLRREVASLRAQLARQQIAVAARAEAPAEKPPAPGASEPEARRQTFDERREAARAGLAEATSHLASRFASERRDPAWGPRAATDMTSDLKRAGFDRALQAVDCASSMCRVVLDLADEELREELGERVTDVPAMQTQLFYQHEPERTPPRVTLYVARPGHTLPLASVR
jgi:hypothetical protein